MGTPERTGRDPVKITRNVFAIYSILADKKGWVSAPDLSKAIGVPRQNIAYTINPMLEEGIIERTDPHVLPVHYRLPEQPTLFAIDWYNRIQSAREIYENRLTKKSS